MASNLQRTFILLVVIFQGLSLSLEGVSHIATGGDNVFASEGSNIYRYSTDLVQQQTHVLEDSNDVLGLATTTDGEWLIACIATDNCFVRNGSDISTGTRTIDDAVGEESNRIALFTAGIPGGQSFYAGSYGTINDVSTDGIRFGQYGFAGSNSIDRSSVGVVSGFGGRNYYGGFSLPDYAYFVVVDEDGATPQLRIVRVCSSGSIGSQYELQLQCDSSLLSTAIVRGASLMNQETLVIGLTNIAGNRLCTFNMSDINSRMDAVYSSCVVAMSSDNRNLLWSENLVCNSGIGSNPTMCDFTEGDAEPVAIAPSLPLMSSNILTNTSVREGLRATIGLTIDNIDVIFIGYNLNGAYYLNKYLLLSNGSLDLIEEMVPVSSSELEMTDEVNIVASQDKKLLFVTTVNEIVSIATENCSSASSCDECVSISDPLCGWCVLEGKCSRSSSCMDSESTGRYLTQGQQDSCIDRIIIEPSKFVQDLEDEPYEVSISFIPSLSSLQLTSEELLCVFTSDTLNEPVKTVLSNGVCNVGAVLDKLSEISLNTQFAIESSRTGVKFVVSSDSYVFYNCDSQDYKCSDCVVASGVCGWCQLDFKCTGDNTTCIEGPSDWLTTNGDDSYTDVCPLLVANSGDVTDYTQPIDVAQDLTLKTLNTPSISGLNYECLVGNNTVIPATRVSDTTVVCNIGQGNELQSNMDTETRNFTLRQTYMSNGIYDMETNASVDINVVLYNCPSLAGSCSRCLGQNINTGFQCGWCGNQCTVSSQCNSQLVTVSGECNVPSITDITPASGPPRGQTTITIDGTDLGVELSNIVSVSVGGRTCNVIESQYSSGVRIVCTISASTDPTDTERTVRVTISTSSGPRVATSDQFTIVIPSVESITPTYGPVSGGTLVNVIGNNLDIGNKENTRVLFRESSTSRRRKRQSCPETECDINQSSFNSSHLSCSSAVGNSSDCVMTVVVNINEDEYSNDNEGFQYTPDPVFTSVSPQEVILAGGVKVVFIGSNLNVTQSPMIIITDTMFTSSSGMCVSTTGSSMECIFPAVAPLSQYISDVVDSMIEYTVLVDGANGPDTSLNELQLTLRANPRITRVITREIILQSHTEDVIRIEGSNLLTSLRDDTTITITTASSEVYNCKVISIDSSEITCEPPNITMVVTAFVTVMIGQTLTFGEESNNWMVSFISEIPQSVNVAAIAGGIGGGVFVLLIVFGVVVIGIVFLARRNSKRKDIRFIKLMSDMERMEVEMAVTCKTAFTELQTDLGELVTEEALESQQLPFHPFPTYATKFFFPNAGLTHPVMCPPRLPDNIPNDEWKSKMDEFHMMILDKDFLCAFIKTLETQPNITVHEKSTIASLLMVSCLKNIDYATEILQILLGDLIRRNLSQSRNHPKILLRRTESVAEKLLTNWFCVTLYPHLLETVGPPLFVLFKAVKAQLEKGPVDVISGEAKNSLSEEKLLRQALDFKSIECEVDIGNGHYLLSRMKNRPIDFEPSNAPPSEIQTVKLLDSDSISQTKEKLLDFLYRNRPVSMRPSITEVELELCRGNVGISLRDQDSTSKKEGEWTKINTLGHYDIPIMADAAIEDPKKPTPRFRLRLKSDRPVSGANFDVPGTIITSASVTSQTSLRLAAVQSIEGSNKLYHLVKPDTGDGESKIVSEVFLTRLLSTKRILQPYVEDLFHAIFTFPREKPLPKAIKVFFDFLDVQAAELNIADPEVLHIWKTNGLSLRFWVNLIKNPEFIFDINKSATIDACFTVIAQAYIDACSTSEVKYTRDTPSARLLYAKEVQNYKSEVQSYYDGIHSLPSIESDELKAYFKENLDPLIEEFERHEGVHFYIESALLELYRYAVQYGDQISETLSEDRLTMVAAQFNSLRQKFNLDSSHM